MPSDFQKRLKRLLKEKKMTQSDLSKITGITQSSISDWIKGKYLPRQDKVFILAKALQVSPSYLLGYDDVDENLSFIPESADFKKTTRVPILGKTIYERPELSEENFEGYISLDTKITKADFCLYADGDSMTDAGIEKHDIVFFKKTSVVDNGLIAAVRLDDKVTLKKVTKIDDDLLLQACNKKYGPLIIRKEDSNKVTIIGEMVGLFKKKNQ